MARIIFEYQIPVPGQPMAGWVPPEPPADRDPDADGPWAPEHPVYDGPDPWQGQAPMFRSMGFVALRGDEEDAVIQQASGANEMSLTRRLAIRSLAEVDGEPIKRSAFQADALWKQVPGPIRDLWMMAYRRHNAVAEVTAATFLVGGCSKEV